MKKCLALILAVLYFTASSGIVLNMHYCMGHLASVKVDAIGEKKCFCGAEQPQDDCCHDEVKVLKVNNDHKASVAVFNTALPFSIALPVRISLMDVSKLTSQKVKITPLHSPPDIKGPSNNILYGVFLI